MSRHFKSFEDFWPFYVGEHRDPRTRMLHFIGSSCVLGMAAGAVVTRRWPLMLLLPVVGYGFAWVGHYGFEKNQPATFKHPAYSFIADWVMWSKILRGQMNAEVRKLGA